MASLNLVQLIGYLGRDPEHKSGNNYQIASLSLATDESYTDSQGNKTQRTEWHRVIVRDKLAQNCAKFLHKGSMIYVEGKIATRKYTDNDGYERVITEIRAYRIQFLDRKEDRQDQREQATPSRNVTYPENYDDVPF